MSGEGGPPGKEAGDISKLLGKARIPGVKNPTPNPNPIPNAPRQSAPAAPVELDIPDELAARILDISDGRLINGVWEPVTTQEERSQPFGATVEEFENAINYEVSQLEAEIEAGTYPFAADPGAQFLRQLKRQEEYRSSMESRKAAPVVALFAGSLTGVTAPMWALWAPSDANRKMEFASYEDYIEYKRKKNLLKKFKGATKKINILMKATAGFDQSGKARAERREEEGRAETKKDAAALGTGQPSSSKGTAAPPPPAAAARVNEIQPPASTEEEEFESSEWEAAAFDSYAAVAFKKLTDPTESRETLRERVRLLNADLKKERHERKRSAMTRSKMTTRSQVQDAIQVFAQVIENEEGIAVCDFMNALVMKSMATDAETEIFGELADGVSYPLSMETMRDEPKCMLGEAVRKFRPTKPRVVVVVEKRYMSMAINALKKHHEDSGSGGSAFSNLYPALGFVVVPNGTSMSLAKANLMIALARILKRHALAVTCTGGVSVLQQMHQAAIWDVPMIVLDDSGRISDIWMKMWLRRTAEKFNADKAHKLIRSKLGFNRGVESAHMVREILKKGSLMLHSIKSDDSSALERLFRIELQGDQLIETAQRRIKSYRRTIKEYKVWKPKLLLATIFFGLAATLASVFVSNLDSMSLGSGDHSTAKTGLKWIAVGAPAVLVILNNIENFVNFNNMLIIAERANAKVESLLYIYRLRALNFSDSFIDRTSKMERQRKKIEESLEKQRQLEATRIGNRKALQQTMDDEDDEDPSEDEDESNKPDENDQSSGDVITRRQAELAIQLQKINHDFSESGAILSELSSVLDRGRKEEIKNKGTENAKELTATQLHRRRVPSKSRAQKMVTPGGNDPTTAEVSDDDLDDSGGRLGALDLDMMSPIAVATPWATRMDEAARNMDANMQRGVDAANTEIQARSGQTFGGQSFGGKTILAAQSIGTPARRLEGDFGGASGVISPGGMMSPGTPAKLKKLGSSQLMLLDSVVKGAKTKRTSVSAYLAAEADAVDKQIHEFMADLAKETDDMDVVRFIVELAKATKSDVLAFINEQAAAEGWTVPQYMFLQASRAGFGEGPSGWREFAERLAQTAQLERAKYTELMAAASGISVSQYLEQKTAELARAANMTVPQYRRHQLRLQGQMKQAQGAIAGAQHFALEIPGQSYQTPGVKAPQGKLPQLTTPQLGTIKKPRVPKTPVQSLLSSVMSPLAKKSSKIHAEGATKLDRLQSKHGGIASVFHQQLTKSKVRAKAELKEFEDSGLATINSRDYVRYRLSIQLRRFREKYAALHFYSVIVQVCNYVLSAVGSILATVGRPEWVAITVAFSTALQGWLRQNRIEERRLAFRKAAAELADARMKWDAVPMEHKMMQKEIDQLVYRVESAIVSVVDPLPTQVVCPSLESLLLPTDEIEGLDEVVNKDGKQR